MRPALSAIDPPLHSPAAIPDTRFLFVVITAHAHYSNLCLPLTPKIAFSCLFCANRAQKGPKWAMFSADYKWQHDYVRLAFDTGFRFERHKSDNFDKNRISKCFVENSKLFTVCKQVPLILTGWSKTGTLPPSKNSYLVWPSLCLIQSRRSFWTKVSSRRFGWASFRFSICFIVKSISIILWFWLRMKWKSWKR